MEEDFAFAFVTSPPLMFVVPPSAFRVLTSPDKISAVPFVAVRVPVIVPPLTSTFAVPPAV